MKLILVITLIAAASVKASESGCEVSDWGEWSEWNVPNHDSSVESFLMDLEDKDFVEGEKNRALMMALMQEQADILEECIADGTCPQFDNYQNDGFAACNGTHAVTPTATYPCKGIDHLAFVPINNLFIDPTVNGSKAMNDIWGWVDPLDQQEYAIAGMTDGTAFVRMTPNPQDVTDVQPVVLGHLRTAAGIIGTTWRDIKVFNDHAFIVSEHPDHGMQVFDLTRLRALTGNPPVRLDADAHYNGTGHVHNVVGSERGYMYVVGSVARQYPNNCRGGLHVINVQDPLNPTYEGCFGTDGYVHDAQCLVYNGPDVDYQGREMCFCYNEDTFTIVDVEDKTNMFNISRMGYNSSAYTHQGWLTEDHTMVLMDDELDERRGDPAQKTYIVDVTDLENPVLMNTYRGLDSIDHNQYIIGDLTYQANYRTGLRILRIDQANFALNEEAYFDVYPEADGVIFNGAWSSYPYFPSGNIPVNTIEYGLHILRPTSAFPNQPNPDTPRKPNNLQRRRSRQILQADDFTACPALEEVETK